MISRLPPVERSVGWGGVVAGLLAAWVAMPPVEIRSWAPSAALGLLALAAGVRATAHGERRIGRFAIASGLLGGCLGVLATRSSTSHLEAVVVWSALLAAMLRYATPLVFAAIGGMFSDRKSVV